MTIEPVDLQRRLQALLEAGGTVLTEAQLARMAEWYPKCPGKDAWDVREYASSSGLGAREYRVIRGTSVQEVYRSPDRGSAAAVRAVLNELDSQQKAPA
ncbi:MAG: hypothetical protein ACREMJ_00910 [Gemmatimonadales bacterium]